MTCNAAVTITKAALSDERLKALLTPGLVQAALTDHFSDLPIAAEIRITRPYYHSGLRNGEVDHVWVYLPGGLRAVVYQQGRVQVSGPDRAVCEQMTEELTTLLAGIADLAFAAKIREALSVFADVKPETVEVEYEGQRRVATLLSLSL